MTKLCTVFCSRFFLWGSSWMRPRLIDRSIPHHLVIAWHTIRQLRTCHVSNASGVATHRSINLRLSVSSSVDAFLQAYQAYQAYQDLVSQVYSSRVPYTRHISWKSYVAPIYNLSEGQICFIPSQLIEYYLRDYVQRFWHIEFWLFLDFPFLLWLLPFFLRKFLTLLQTFLENCLLHLSEIKSWYQFD